MDEVRCRALRFIMLDEDKMIFKKIGICKHLMSILTEKPKPHLKDLTVLNLVLHRRMIGITFFKMRRKKAIILNYMNTILMFMI